MKTQCLAKQCLSVRPLSTIPARLKSLSLNGRRQSRLPRSRLGSRRAKAGLRKCTGSRRDYQDQYTQYVLHRFLSSKFLSLQMSCQKMPIGYRRTYDALQQSHFLAERDA